MECDCPSELTELLFGVYDVKTIEELIAINEKQAEKLDKEYDSLSSISRSFSEKEQKTMKTDYYYVAENSDGKLLHSFRHVELNGNFEVKRIYSNKKCTEEHPENRYY